MCQSRIFCFPEGSARVSGRGGAAKLFLLPEVDSNIDVEAYMSTSDMGSSPEKKRLFALSQFWERAALCEAQAG